MNQCTSFSRNSQTEIGIIMNKNSLLEPAFLKKLERLSFVTKRPLAGQMKGEKRSTKRGTSIEFADYREYIALQLKKLRYTATWQLVNASEFGVSQVRPRAILVAIQKDQADSFIWPDQQNEKPLTVGACLYDLMSEKRWRGAKAWRDKASSIAPAIVGGSKKHGGPDLGPKWAKQAWAELGVNGHLVADEPPDRDPEPDSFG